jgi:septal ring factor EnvC (AmiA/AmiB activator)
MSRSRHAVGVLIVTVFGLWGCSRAPSADGAATADKLKAVEAKLARLEDDFRAVASARDQLSKKLIAAEEARVALARDAKAKDEQLQTRTAERDQAAGQYKALTDELRGLLSKAESGMKEPSPAVPVIPTSHTRPDLPAVPDLPQARGR